MKVVLESTTKIVELVTPQGNVPARIWEGKTERGIACHAYVTRIAVHENDDASQFEAELEEHRKPTAPIEAIPLRLVL
jgi:hypothetical protein